MEVLLPFPPIVPCPPPANFHLVLTSFCFLATGLSSLKSLCIGARRDLELYRLVLATYDHLAN